MKKTQCQSIAKSTQKQCEKSPLSGTPYCWLHYPKKATIEFFILGILLTFLLQTAFDLITISPEEQQIKDLSIQNQELIDGKNILIAKLDKYQKDLNEKEQKIKELEEKTKKAELGITKFYWPSGKLREQVGNTITDRIELVTIFEKMKSLQEQKKFNDLKNLCNEQIIKNREWPTPYLYLGAALANLGDTENAIANLEYFLKIAPTEQPFGYGNFRKQAEETVERLKNN